MRAVKQQQTSRERCNNVEPQGDGDSSNVGKRGCRTKKINPLSPPSTVEIRGIPVHFPFKPYDVQITYMATVMDSLLRGENALLESPTGTGKTLCLLCASLAWQREQSRLININSAGSISDLLDSNTNTSCLSQQSMPNAETQAPKADNRIPTIIYASRTHSQLSQVVRELRNTRYRPRHAVLGSREQMCVNPKVKKSHVTGSDINHDCNRLGKERKCRYRNNVDGFVAPYSWNETYSDGRSYSTSVQQPVMDMEDLVKMGKESKVCPFYYTRGLLDKAELILLPYNYLFDKDSRQTTLAEIPWDNAVVIFDEAHNLESFASESASFDLTCTDVAGCVAEVSKCINYAQTFTDSASNLKLDNLVKLKALFLQLEDHIMNLPMHQTTFSGEYIMEIFRRGASITHANHEIFVEEVRRVIDFLMDIRQGSSSASSNSSSGRTSLRLEHFVQCLKRVYGFELESRCLAKAAFYRVYVSPKPSAQHPTKSSTTKYSKNWNNNANNGRTVSYWCFAPALAMEELSSLNIRSILVTSGTLSPLQSYSMELGLKFSNTLENPHIIKNSQICVRVVGKGPTGKELTSSFDRRNNEEYYSELGNTLISLAKVVPAGMLVFFPSYSVMNACVEKWGGPSSTSNSGHNHEGKNSFFAARRKQTATYSTSGRYSFPHAPSSFGVKCDSNGGLPLSHWKRLLATKSVVLEPKTSAELPDALREFEEYLDAGNSPGCILMGVCRGKISEGIDFANEQSRAVVITGLPFPPAMDPKVKIKREYLDGMRAKSRELTNRNADSGFGASSNHPSSTSDTLSGNEWYIQQAHRSVNQAIGRVIRNQSDYGAVLLLDARFSQSQNQAGLSKWIRPHIVDDTGFGTTIRSLASFFQSAEAEATARTEAQKCMNALQAPPVLAYEDDENTCNDSYSEKPSKIALIKRPDDSDRQSVKDSSFVPPASFVARMDIRDLKPESIESKRLAPPIQGPDNVARHSKTVRATNDSIFERGHKIESVIASKETAVIFMAKVKSKFSPSEQTTIRKAIVAMKQFGERNERNRYLQSASDVCHLVIRREKFELHSRGPDRPMLLLFFALLPKTYRLDVESNAFELIFRESSLGNLCKENLTKEDYKILKTKMKSFLPSFWNANDPSAMLSNGECYHQIKDVLVILIRADKVAYSDIFNSLCKILPIDVATKAQIMANEMQASVNIELLKRADKARAGEHMIDLDNFKIVSSTALDKPGSSATIQQPEVQTAAVSRLVSSVSNQVQQIDGVSSVKRKILVEPLSKNPYARKKALHTNTRQTEIRTSMIQSNQSKVKSPHSDTSSVPFVSSYLKWVESETCLKFKSKPKDLIVQKFGNDPVTGIECPVCCADSVHEPHVADCGHVACLRCWLSWLERSNTCMTCRVPTVKDSLARVVYEEGAVVTGLLNEAEIHKKQSKADSVQPSANDSPDNDQNDCDSVDELVIE